MSTHAAPEPTENDPSGVDRGTRTRPDGQRGTPDNEREPRVIFRDKRRLDPETGERRTPDAAPSGAAPAVDPAAKITAEPDVKAAELQADLQRVAAEYSNYRRRVERDRVAVGEQATGAVLASLLPVLDDIERAREHGDLTGSFVAVAESLQAALTKLGLTAFGEVGDVFDPNRHEAVMHQTSVDVTGPTCVMVMRRGYLIGERLLRPAMVAVAEPEPVAEPVAEPEPAAADSAAEPPAEQSG